MLGCERRLPIGLVQWSELVERRDLMAALDRIFFESSATQSFANMAERATFHDRWLGRYREHCSNQFWVAVDREQTGVGYLAGTQRSPMRDQLCADHAYYESEAFAGVVARFPAHFHINVDRAWRDRGVGGALVAAFRDACRRAGLAGLHVVTAKGARNIAFYERQGMACQAEAHWRGRELVLLGERL